MNAIKIAVGITSSLLLLVALLGLIGGIVTASRADDSGVAIVSAAAIAGLMMLSGLPGLAVIWFKADVPWLRRSGMWACSAVLGVLSCGVGYSFVQYATGGKSGTPPGPAFLGLGVMNLVLLSEIAALARLGRLHRRAKDPTLDSGGIGGIIAYAFWALVCVGIIGFGGVETIRGGLRSARAEAPPAERPSRVERFPELNFTFQVPVSYRTVPPERFNPSAKLMAVNAKSGAYFAIIAERLGDDAAFTPESFAELVRTEMKARLEDCTMGALTASRAAGIDGREFKVDARVSGMHIQYVFWVAFHNGMGYQLMDWAAAGGSTDLAQEGERLRAGFSLIDPEATAAAVPAPAAPPQSAPRFGLTLDQGGAGWMTWKTVAKTNRFGVLGAKRGLTAAAMLVPVRLGTLNPPVEALESALLGILDIEHPGPRVKVEGPFERGDVRGRVLSASRQSKTGKTYIYRFRVIRLGDVACMAAAWREAGTGSDEELDKLLDRVDLARTDPPEMSEWTEGERDRQGRLINDIGLYHYNRKQWPEALAVFRAAMEWAPKNETIVKNVAETLRHTSKPEAVRFLGEQAPAFPGSTELAMLHASVLQESGDTAGAISAYGAAFHAGHGDDDYLDAYIRLLIEAKELDRADKDLATYAGDDDPRRVLKAKIRRGQGRTDEAVAILRDGLEASPVDTQAGEDLLGLLADLDRHSEVVEAAERLETAGHKNAYTLYYKARAQMELDRLPAAKESLEAALAERPANASIKEALADVNARLGRGDTSAIRTPIEAVPRPETALAGAPQYEPDAGAVAQERVRAMRFEPGKVWRRTDYFRIKVLDKRGVDALSSFQFEFDPRYERMFVSTLEVLAPDGSVVFKGDPETYYIADESGSEHASQKRTLHIPVGSLSPGRTLVLAVTTEDLSAPQEFPYTQFLFWDTLPAARTALVVYADPALVRRRAAGGAQERAIEGGFMYTVDRLAAWRREPHQPRLDTYVPSVRLCGERGTWEEQGREYLKRLAPRLEPGEKTAALGRKLVEELGTDEEKIRAIAAHVQSEYTYKALAFGPRAQIPQPCDETVANRYGDCKDHALLTHLLLRAAGVESRLALATFDGTVDPELPAAGQFDHMIVYLPSSGRFLDLTSKDTDPLLSPPPGLAGQTALVLDPERPRLEQIPAPGPDSQVVDSVRDVRLEGGDLEVEETVSFSGLAAEPVRRAVRRASGAELLTMLAPELATAGAELREAAAEHASETSMPLVLKLKYRVPRAFTDAGGKLAGVLPYAWERRSFVEDFVRDRATPFEHAGPITVRSTVRLRTGDGIAPAAPESLSLDIRGQHASAQRRVETAPGLVTITSTLRLDAGRFPAAEYAAHAEFTSRAMGALEKDLVLERR